MRHIRSISELHSVIGAPKPRHPLISFINFSDINPTLSMQVERATTDFFIISLKTTDGQLKYGRSYYDFAEGTLVFSAPNQVVYSDHLAAEVADMKGWSLFFHADLLHGTQLARKIHEYGFFSYDVQEALHLSDAERQKIKECTHNIVDEYSQNLDQHSQELIVSNLELLLNYCRRFYERQFLTRHKQNRTVVGAIERLLKDYFEQGQAVANGLPSVKYCADHVHLSPNYLSDLLRKETGKNTKEHIDHYLLAKAKDLLVGTEMNIGEIAYQLGFEQPKSFSKLFKKKVGLTPTEFRSN